MYFCKPRCGSDVRNPTQQGIAKVHEAIKRLGHPDTVDYTDIADAFTPKMENGEPEHTDGHLTFSEAGADITCLCILEDAMRECGYVPGTDGNYVREV
jgi:hypothetical protein